jgi:hypothetical protein
MHRRWIPHLSVVCLALCGFAIAVGILSFWRGVVVWSYRLRPCVSGRGTGQYGVYDDNSYELTIARGALLMDSINGHYVMNPVLHAFLLAQEGTHARAIRPRSVYGQISIPKVQGLGFKYGIAVTTGGVGSSNFKRGIILPLWAIAALFGVFPVRVMIDRWRNLASRRVAAGCCAACAYDLTANTSGVCPECGTMVGSRKPVKAAALRD